MSGRTQYFMGLCLVMLAGCSSQLNEATGAKVLQKPDNSKMQIISGEVWYRERIALPPGAEVIVTLEDQSRADAPAITITDYTHVSSGQPPFPFRLVYDPTGIDDRKRYGLRAKVVSEGKLLFSSTEHIDPFSGNPVRIMVSRTGNK